MATNERTGLRLIAGGMVAGRFGGVQLDEVTDAGQRAIQTCRPCNGQGCISCGGLGFYRVYDRADVTVLPQPSEAERAEAHSVRVPSSLTTAAARLLGACDTLQRLGTTGTVGELLGGELAELDAAWRAWTVGA